MMSFWDILLLSVALAMDCFAVSIASGVILTPNSPKGEGSLTPNPSPVGKESPTPNPSPVGRGTRKAFLTRGGLEEALRLSALFGLFQAGMPLVGWICTNWLAERIEAYDHWIAFGLLVFLGGRMIRDAFSDEEEAHHFDPTNWWTGIVLAGGDEHRRTGSRYLAGRNGLSYHQAISYAAGGDRIRFVPVCDVRSLARHAVWQ